jgi:hypothetical protein
MFNLGWARSPSSEIHSGASRLCKTDGEILQHARRLCHSFAGMCHFHMPLAYIGLPRLADNLCYDIKGPNMNSQIFTEHL